MIFSTVFDAIDGGRSTACKWLGWAGLGWAGLAGLGSEGKRSFNM